MPVELRFFVSDHASIGPFVLDRTIAVGRSTDAELPLPDNSLSRRHSLIQPHDSGVSVQDLGSTNGTWYRRVRVTECYVPCGEEFWVGHTRILVARAGIAAQPLPSPGQPPAVIGGPTPPPRQALAPDLQAEATMSMRKPAWGSGAATGTEPERVMAKTAAPFKVPVGVAAQESSRPVVKTAPPIRAFQPEPKTITEPPKPVYGAAGAAPAVAVAAAPGKAGKAPLITVSVDGKPCPVTSVHFDFATNEAGDQYVQIAVAYEAPGGGQATAATWLCGV